MSQKTMLLGTDGNGAQLIGLRLFFQTLSHRSPSAFEEWEIVIVHPSYVIIDRAFFADIAPTVTVLPMFQERHADKYYVKLLLKEFVENTGDEDDHILYLDYDHVVRSEIHLPSIKEGELYVGSEVKPLSAVVDQSLFSPSDMSILLNTHYNASLIYGTNRTFRKAVDRWLNLYEECLGKVAARYVEEIAFFLSARRAGCYVASIPLEVQSGWQMSTSECSLFHYGGEHHLAIAIKQSLALLSNKTPNHISVFRNQLTFAGELINLMQELN